MNKALFTIFVIVSQSINAQNGEDLFAEMEPIDSIDQRLLPDRMLFTQRLLWGEKGAMRFFKRYELTPENREKELKLRRKFLITHQILGYVTLADDCPRLYWRAIV